MPSKYLIVMGQTGKLGQSTCVQDLYFSYDIMLCDVLQGLNIEILARTSIALLGESSSGKSTVMLKLRKGRVLRNGVSGAEIQLASWRKRIGHVSQETMVFDGSIA